MLKTLLLAAFLCPAAPDQAQILQSVLDAVGRIHASGGMAVVIFDLDDTLLDPGPRNLQVLRELASERADRFPELARRAGSLTSEEMRFALRDTLAALGITQKDRVNEAYEFWAPRFFSSAYLAYDVANPGAVDFVKAVVARGGVAVYLTGRNRPRMGAGTEASLSSCGFPMDAATTRLVLKPDSRIGDIFFKSWATDKIRQIGTVVAAFDNEPENVNMLWKAYPDAAIVLPDTRKSPDAPALDKGILTIKDFRLAR